jgi:hypothetical protein
MLEVGGEARLADERERVVMAGRILGIGGGGKESGEKDRKGKARKIHERHRPYLIGNGSTGSVPRRKGPKAEESRQNLAWRPLRPNELSVISRKRARRKSSAPPVIRAWVKRPDATFLRAYSTPGGGPSG